jgi:hypothetical protein
MTKQDAITELADYIGDEAITPHTGRRLAVPFGVSPIVWHERANESPHGLHDVEGVRSGQTVLCVSVIELMGSIVEREGVSVEHCFGRKRWYRRAVAALRAKYGSATGAAASSAT